MTANGATSLRQVCLPDPASSSGLRGFPITVLFKCFDNSNQNTDPMLYENTVSVEAKVSCSISPATKAASNETAPCMNGQQSVPDGALPTIGRRCALP